MNSPKIKAEDENSDMNALYRSFVEEAEACASQVMDALVLERFHEAAQVRRRELLAVLSIDY